MAQNRCSALLDHIDMIASVGVVALAVKRRYQTGNDDDPSVSSRVSGIGKKSVPTMFSFPKCFSHLNSRLAQDPLLPLEGKHDMFVLILVYSRQLLEK